MDAEVLKIVGQVAGIGGISLGVFLLLFREVIKKNIFPNLKQDHAYSLLKLALLLIWSIALIGIVAWIFSGYLQQTSNHTPTNYNSKYDPSKFEQKDNAPKTSNHTPTNYSSKYDPSKFEQKDNKSALKQDELIEILNMRAKKINDELSKYYKYANVKKYLDEFNRLHKLHIEALKNGNLVLAHEILVDIHKLSSELESDEFWTRHKIEEPDTLYSLCGDAFQRGELVYGYICGDMKNCNYASDKGIFVSRRTAELEKQYSISFVTSIYKSILNSSIDYMPINPLFVSDPSLTSDFCEKSGR